MFTSLSVFVFMLASVKLTQGAEIDPYECTPGQGFAKYPDECDKYYQCMNDGNSMRKVAQNCSFGTVWDHDASTCSTTVKCPYDKCKSLPSSARYKANANCRGFYECVDKISKPGCCAIGEEYDEKRGCIIDSDESCKDQCFGKPGPIPTECDKRPTDDDPGAFEQSTSTGWQLMKCAPGSLYEDRNCSCEGFGPAPTQPIFCRRELYLPFENDLKDHSGYNHAVLDTNVELNGQGNAIFNGQSRLSIPRFENLDHKNSLYINIKYTATSVERKRRVLLSNRCENTEYSIMITHRGERKRFRVITTDENISTVNIRKNQDNGEQDVIFQLNNERITAVSGPEIKQADAPGYIEKINCPFNIGWAARGKGFIGEINEVSIYLCNPNPRT